MKAMRVLIALTVLTLLPTFLIAAEEKANGTTVTGLLRRVAVTDREIVVIGPGAKGAETETTITVPPTVRVLRDGKAIQFAELKEGETVTVAVEKRDGRLSAQTIQLGAAAIAAEKKPSRLVPRLRLILRIADGVLQQMEKKEEP